MNVDLFDDGDTVAPRAAWHVIEAARHRRLTGMLVLGSNPATHVYLRDGQVYWAERSTDGNIGVRLVVEGVITREQLMAGSMMVGGVQHLGRLFERAEHVDRHAVELSVELMTDEVLTQVAPTEVDGYRMVLYQRHPSGIDRWLPNRIEPNRIEPNLIEVVTHLLDEARLADPQGAPATAAPPRLRAAFAPPASVITSELPLAAPSVAPVGPAAPASPTMPPMSVAPASAAAVAPAVPVTTATPDEPDLALAASIADEVAEAVRRALAAIDAATASPIDTGELRRIVDDSGTSTAAG